MQRSAFPLLLAVFFSCVPFALEAQSRTDSLYAAAQALPNDSTKAFKINEIAAFIARSNPSLAQRYAEEAFTLSEKTGFPAGQAKAHNTLGIVALNTGQMEEALENYTEALRICNRYNLRQQKAEVLRGMGNYFRESGDTEAARNYALQSVTLSREMGDSLSVAKSLNNLGTLVKGPEQLTHYLHAATILEALITTQTATAEATLLVIIYNNLSSQYMSQNNPEKALAYSDKAVAMNKKINNEFNNILVYNQIASIYNTQGKYEEALRNALLSLELAKKSDNRGMTMANLQGLLSNIYKNLRNYPAALQHSEEAARLFRNQDNNAALAQSIYEAADILLKSKDYPKALARANDALNLARMHESIPLMAACEGLSGEIFAGQGDDTQALERLLRATTLIDQNNLPKAGFADLYQILATLYTRQGQAEKALQMQAVYDALSVTRGN